MGESLDVVLADDQVVLIDALAGLLSHQGHRVVASATSRQSLVDDVKTFEPDVCVTDSRFRDGDGLAVLFELSLASPRTRFVVLTGDSSTETMRRALDAGAAAVVHKSRRVAVLLDVLERVRAGEVVIEGSFLRPDAVQPGAQPQLRRLAAYLTDRELECLGLLTEGMDTEMMSRELGVSRTTVRSHVQAVLNKLGVHSRLEAASMAVRFGLVEFPEPRRSVAGGAK